MFIHLRSHSAYSLATGAMKLKELVARAQKLQMPALAVTDTNNLFGALEFSSSAQAAGLQPIIGAEISFYDSKQRWHEGALVLLVQNEQGYLNLLKLVSALYTQPNDENLIACDYQSLTQENCQGLIALTGSANGGLNAMLCQEQEERAQELLERLSSLFEHRLYIELQRHGMSAQRDCEDALLGLADRLSLPLVATNNAHYLDPEFFEAHEVLLCISGGTKLDDESRKRLTNQHYFKSTEEMQRLFADIPEAIENTVQIAKRCGFAPNSIKPLLPRFDAQDGMNEDEALRVMARKGLEERFTKGILQVYAADQQEAQRQIYLERLERELDVIISIGYPGYFLIVADFIQWAKSKSIPVGPGRGSGAGSLVAYCLSITDIDPLPFGLLFERFLNPERISMPDFDVDFCQDRRDEVIAYVQERYGYERTAQIITFGKLQARAALRDVGRVLGMPYGQVDRICKLVPNNPAKPVSLEEALLTTSELREAQRDDANVNHLLTTAMQLEGLYRNASTHAAGVVIADRPLYELVPLYRDPRSEMPATQFNMKWVENAGLVKFDFLGLKTLTILQKSVEFVKATEGKEIDLSTLHLDDSGVYEMMAQGKVLGVFQLESGGMVSALLDLKPDRFEDIIAVISLYRPGPMENIPAYCRRKHGKEEPDYMHPVLEEMLRETHGIMIYQEQVMLAAQLLAGYSLGSADILRRAMGKKDEAQMLEQRKVFREGALKKHQVDEKLADHIFDQIQKFSGYGFNKSHAAAYALVSYQTAYMKHYYPHEFLAAVLSYELNNTDKIALYIKEAKRLGIKMLPPDVNHSLALFNVEIVNGEKCIRYALSAIKNVGENAINVMVQSREQRPNKRFSDLADFFGHCDERSINKRLLENLVYAGAFDSLYQNRFELLSNLELCIKLSNAQAKARSSATLSLFGEEQLSMKDLRMTPCKPWSKLETAKGESQAIGFYLQDHPLDEYKSLFDKLNVVPYSQALEQSLTWCKFAGVIEAVQLRTSARNNRYARLILSSADESFEIMLFSDQLEAKKALLSPDTPVIMDVSIRYDDERTRVNVNKIQRLEEVRASVKSKYVIRLDDEQKIQAFKDLSRSFRAGRSEIDCLLPLQDGRELTFELPSSARFDIGPNEKQQLFELGIDCQEK